MSESRSVLLLEDEAGGLYAKRLPNGWALEESKPAYCYQLTNGETIYTLLMGYGGHDRANVMITMTGPWEEMRMVNKASLAREDDDWSCMAEWFSKVLSAELPEKETGERIRVRCGDRACSDLQEVFDCSEESFLELVSGGLSFGLKDPDGETWYFRLKVCPFCTASVQTVPKEFFDEDPPVPGI